MSLIHKCSLFCFYCKHLPVVGCSCWQSIIIIIITIIIIWGGLRLSGVGKHPEYGSFEQVCPAGLCHGMLKQVHKTGKLVETWHNKGFSTSLHQVSIHHHWGILAQWDSHVWPLYYLLLLIPPPPRESGLAREADILAVFGEIQVRLLRSTDSTGYEFSSFSWVAPVWSREHLK